MVAFAPLCFGGFCCLCPKNGVFAVDERRYEVFRENLKLDYKCDSCFKPNGKEIDFSKRDEANRLYLKLKEFLSKNENVDPADFSEKMSKDVIYSGEGSPNILNRHDFEDYLNKNKNALRLFHTDSFCSDVKIAEAKERLNKKEPVSVLNEMVGGNFEEIVKRRSTQNGLRTTNCVEVADDSRNHDGPWRLWVCSDLAINRDDPGVKVVDEEYMENLIAIIKYDHPDEFGFIDAIEKYFDEGIAKEKIEAFKDISEQEKKVRLARKYMEVPFDVYFSRLVHVDELCRKHIGMSYFDYEYKLSESDMKKFSDTKDACKELCKEINDYDRSFGLYVCGEALNEDEDEDEKLERSDLKNHYYINRSFAAINNISLLAKLLGYNVLFRKYNIHEGEIAELNIKENPDNGEYKILDRKNFVVCCEPKIKERVVDGEGNYVETGS